MGWWAPRVMPSRDLPDGGAPALDAPVGEGGEGLRVALAGGEGLQDARAVFVFASECTTDDSLTRAPSSSFSSRCHSRVRSRTSWRRARVRSRSARISGGGTNDGRSRPISASRASHWASSRSVFGRPASCRACAGVHQLDVQPGGLQQVEPDPPVVRGGLHDHELDAVGEQPGGQRQDLAAPSRGPSSTREPAARPRAPGAAGCTRPPSPSRCRSPPPARGGAGSPRPLLAARESSALSHCPPWGSYP